MIKETSVLVSLIIPVYNAEKYLPKLIECLKSQTYTNIEIILINDGSKDNSGNICDDFAQVDKRVVVVHQENKGVSATRNLGIDISKGEYIGFIDADDLIDCDYVKVLTQNIIDNKADISCCNYKEIFNDYNGEELIFTKIIEKDTLIKDTIQLFSYPLNGLMWHTLSVVWGNLFRKTFIGKLRFSSIKFSEDLLFMMNLVSLSPIVHYSSWKGYTYIRWDESATMNNKKLIKDKPLNHIVVYNEIFNLCKNTKNKNLISLAENKLIDCIYSSISMLLKNGDKTIYDEQKDNIYIYAVNTLKFKNCNKKNKFMIRIFCFNKDLYWNLIGKILKIKG